MLAEMNACRDAFEVVDLVVPAILVLVMDVVVGWNRSNLALPTLPMEKPPVIPEVVSLVSLPVGSSFVDHEAHSAYLRLSRRDQPPISMFQTG